MEYTVFVKSNKIDWRYEYINFWPEEEVKKEAAFRMWNIFLRNSSKATVFLSSIRKESNRVRILRRKTLAQIFPNSVQTSLIVTRVGRMHLNICLCLNFQRCMPYYLKAKLAICVFTTSVHKNIQQKYKWRKKKSMNRQMLQCWEIPFILSFHLRHFFTYFN